MKLTSVRFFDIFLCCRDGGVLTERKKHMARVNRIKAEGVAHYHVISRIANQAFLLKDARIKDTVVDMLYRAAEFSGVDVLSYVKAPLQEEIRVQHRGKTPSTSKMKALR